MNRVTLLAVLFFSVVIMLSIEYAGSQTLDKTENFSRIQSDINSQNMIRRSDDTLINSEGWIVPRLKLQQITKTSQTDMKDKSGRSQAVTVIDYNLKDNIVYEPFNLVGLKEGKIKIQFVRKFKKEDRIFAYLVTAQIAKREKNSINFTPLGNFFFYAFTDEDGDGKFETLLQTPSASLAIPDWVLKN